jgi:hypothetical protein
VFEIAAKHNLIVAVHAEDEQMMRERKARYQDRKDYMYRKLKAPFLAKTLL